MRKEEAKEEQEEEQVVCCPEPSGFGTIDQRLNVSRSPPSSFVSVTGMKVPSGLNGPEP